MREFWILAGFFATVMATSGLAAYAVLFRRETAAGDSPLMKTLGRIGRASPLRPR